MKKQRALIFLVLCAGCASVAEPQLSFDQDAQRWVGRPSADLVAARGVPTRTLTRSYEGGEMIEKTLEYSGASALARHPSASNSLRPVMVNGQWVMMPEDSVMAAGKSAAVDCKLVFKTDAGSVIRSWFAAGKECR